MEQRNEGYHVGSRKYNTQQEQTKLNFEAGFAN